MKSKMVTETMVESIVALRWPVATYWTTPEVHTMIVVDVFGFLEVEDETATKARKIR